MVGFNMEIEKFISSKRKKTTKQKQKKNKKKKTGHVSPPHALFDHVRDDEIDVATSARRDTLAGLDAEPADRHPADAADPPRAENRQPEPDGMGSRVRHPEKDRARVHGRGLRNALGRTVDYFIRIYPSDI
jgi:hypothetical protein